MELTGIQVWIWLIAVGAGGAGLATGLVFLFRWLRDEEQGYPGEQQIEAALLPIIRHAIMAAYKWSEGSLDQFGERLDGLDKAKLASYVYNLLPEHVHIGENATLPLGFIKLIVTEERFSELVQMAYDEFAEWFEEVREGFGDKLDELLGGEPGDANAVVRSLAR